MAERVLCVDTSIWVKYLTPDEQDKAADELVLTAIQEGARLVAPAWAWAEFGTVLRKKCRQGLVPEQEAENAWQYFMALPIQSVDTPVLRQRAWELAHQYQLLTLYDATFLACTETALAPVDAVREFWTADEAFLRSLGLPCPQYVRRLAP